jgi:3-methyladenine DNA glycosylase AlkC
MAEPLKNLFSKELINSLAKNIKQHYNKFNPNAFIGDVFDNTWNEKELKQRMRHITICLHKHIELPYPQQVEILSAAAPTFKGFIAMFFPDFIEVYGLNDLTTSINALELFTQYSSSEFAVRPFIIKYPKQMVKQHQKWAQHKNHHIRRLASEGIRPRLPWAMALPEFKKDPTPILPILELLKNDESEYVRKSVANCLNDISKDHPDVLLQTVKKWKGKSKETDWVVKHASRGLLKQGNVDALKTFGLNNQVHTKITQLGLSKNKLKIGDEFSFETTIQLLDKIAHNVRVEYNIYFMKSNGKHSPKIFQVGTYLLNPKQEITIKRKHKFADLTTRKHYPGEHILAVVINGKELARQTFVLQ